jgi:hypothetical protein
MGELRPKLAHQFVGQVFLIDEPGSVLAEAISDVTRVGVLNEALRNSQSDRRTAASDLKLRQSDVAKHELSVKNFDGLDDAIALASEVGAIRTKLSDLQRKLDDARRIRDRLVQAQSEVARLQPVREQGSVDDSALAKTLKAESALDWVLLSSKKWDQARVSHETASKAIHSANQMQLPSWDSSTLLKWQEASSLYRKHGDHLRSAQSIKNDAIEAQSLLLESTSYLSALLSEAGVCPTCGMETHDEATHG